jgi:hypothetical protein
MQYLSKFVQACDVFIYDFVDVVKAYEGDMYRLYVDPITSYGHVNGVFQTFLVIVHYSYDPLHMVWIFEPNFGVEFVGFSKKISHTWFIRRMC